MPISSIVIQLSPHNKKARGGREQRAKGSDDGRRRPPGRRAVAPARPPSLYWGLKLNRSSAIYALLATYHVSDAIQLN